MSFASDISSRISTASDPVKPLEGNGARHRCNLQENPPLYYSPLPWVCPYQSQVFSSPCHVASEHQTPNLARLPACSATLSVIYNPKHSSALSAYVNTDQSMPGSVSQPVAQNAMHRPAPPRLHLLSVTAGVHSQHAHTLPSGHTRFLPNTSPCCFSHEIFFPNAGEVALSGGV
jgi:hypothetical protein